MFCCHCFSIAKLSYFVRIDCSRMFKIIFLFERQNVREGETREIFYLSTHSPDGHSLPDLGQGKARSQMLRARGQEPGTRGQDPGVSGQGPGARG